MNTCLIPKQNPGGWIAVPPLVLRPCRWSPNPPPPVCARLCWTEEALHVRLESGAAPERAVNTTPDSPVWEDSCLEFFFSFDGRNYINLEGNVNGALRASFGPDRHARRLLRELAIPLPAVRAEEGAGSWALELIVPAALIERLCDVTLQSGLRFTGNFYACGDAAPAPYYAAWNEVETETPDFHRPEFFGELILA